MNAAPFIAPAPMFPLAPRRPATSKTKTASKRVLTVAKAPRKAKSTPATPTPLEQQAARLGLPSTLFGFTPNERGYWNETDLPWWTPEMRDNPPLDYQGNTIVPFTAWIGGDRMAPRFPAGAGVMLSPVFDRKNLVLGKVYTYSYRDAESGELEMTIGRLVKICGNYLEVAPDNPGPGCADRTIWLLREDEQKAVWDVREVTHYVSYPDLDTLASAG
jgi:hypothetical protein